MHPTMMALGRAGLYMWSFILSAAASAGGCLLAAGHGIAAVAWAVVFAGALTGLLNFTVLSRLLHFSPAALLRALSPIVAGCGVLAIAVIGMDHALSGHVHAFLKVAMQIVIGGLAYVVSMAFLARGLSAEFYSMAEPLLRPMALRVSRALTRGPARVE